VQGLAKERPKVQARGLGRDSEGRHEGSSGEEAAARYAIAVTPPPTALPPQAPTPVEAHPALGLWVKREDLAGGPYGGNKVRKLAYILPRAAGQPILTFGAAGSHHVLATAIYAGADRVFAVLLPQPYTPHAARNLGLCRALGVRIFAASSLFGLPWATLRARLDAGQPCHWVPPGGSDADGIQGAVDLGLELCADVAAGRMPAPRDVYVALGSGGTAVGLWAGLRLGGLPARVQAIAVTRLPLLSRPNLRRLARLALRGRSVDGPLLDGFVLRTDWLGAGYGHPHPQGAPLDCDGLRLEPTYTSRALGAALTDKPDGERLFIHTANSRPLIGPAFPAPLPEDALSARLLVGPRRG